MSVQSTANAGRSLLGNALHWALPRLAIYIFGSLGAMLTFIAWAFIYTYVWPGKLPVTPPPAEVPVQETPTTPPVSPNPSIPAKPPAVFDPAAVAERVKPLLQVPSDVLPSLRNVDIYIYDPSNSKVGQIKDVLVKSDGTLTGYIIGVADQFAGGQGKDIAVPFQAVGFTMKGGNTFPVLYMTKDAVKNAPKQKFDDYKMRWVPFNTP